MASLLPLECEKVVFFFSRVFLFVCFVLVFSCGCSKSESGILAKGKVLLDGKPCSGALLVFLQEGSGKDLVSGAAVAAEDGSFSARTGLTEGLPAGNYLVSISWPDPSFKLTPQQSMQGMTINDARDKLNGKYSNSKTSKLRVEVKPGMSEIPPFNL